MKKTISIALLALLAISSLALIPGIGAASTTTVERSWVRMRGQIMTWGTTPVFGWIEANARAIEANGTSHVAADAHAFWSSGITSFNRTTAIPKNFNMSFYAANLVKTTSIKYDNTTKDLNITGTWNVNKIIYSYTMGDHEFNYTCAIVPIVANATGQLDIVFSHFSPATVSLGAFTLSITGIDPLYGKVVSYFISRASIVACDVFDSGTVDIRDLRAVAKCYGSMAGMGNFDFKMDFNFDCKIDLLDLTTVALNLRA